MFGKHYLQFFEFTSPVNFGKNYLSSGLYYNTVDIAQYTSFELEAIHCDNSV